MGDAAEGLIDAEARIQERMEERELERRTRLSSATSPANAERLRELQSWQLARTELSRQLSSTTHDTRRTQINQAIAELDRRIGQSN